MPSPYRLNASLLQACFCAALALALSMGEFDATLAKSPPLLKRPATSQILDWTPAENWAWEQIKGGQDANFSTKCGRLATSDPIDTIERDRILARLIDPCRTLRGKFIEDVLTRKPWSEATPHHGVNIIGARIEGDVHLENAKLTNTIFIQASLFENDILLDHVSTEAMISIVYSLVRGQVAASGLRSQSDIHFKSTTFVKDLYLNDADVRGLVDIAEVNIAGLLDMESTRISNDLLMFSAHRNKSHFNDVLLRSLIVDKQIDMHGVTVNGQLNADKLQVGTSLLMQSDGDSKSRFKEVVLRNAKVNGQLAMNGVTIDNQLNADGLHVGGMLLMRSEGSYRSHFNAVILWDANVAGQLDMSGVTVDGPLDADGLHVGGSLLMRSEDWWLSYFNEVRFRGAQVNDQLDTSGAIINGAFDASRVNINDNLLMRDTKFLGHVDLEYATIHQSFDLRGASLHALDAPKVTIDGELRVGDSPTTRKPTSWELINLRNASIGYIPNVETGWAYEGRLDVDGWKKAGVLELNGFTLANMNPLFRDDGEEKRASEPARRSRNMAQWDKWVRRDPSYSASLYLHLANTLRNAGEYEASNDIRFLGRERARQTVCDKDFSFDCFLQSMLSSPISSKETTGQNSIGSRAGPITV